MTEIRDKFISKVEKRKITPAFDYHEAFLTMDDLEIGEEFRDDIWTIIRIPYGWIIKGINIGSIFVPHAKNMKK